MTKLTVANARSVRPSLAGRYRRFVRVITLVSVVGLIVALAACGSNNGGSATKSGHKTIAFSFLYSEIPVAQALKNFAKAHAKELGYTLLTDNIRGGKVDEQINSLNSFFTQKVDALVVHVQDPKAYGGVLKRAREAKIPFFTYFLSAPGSDGGVKFPPGPAAKALSEDAAVWINKNLGGKGEVLILGCDACGPVEVEAGKLLAKSIEDKTDAKVVAQQDALDQPTGLRVTEDALKAHPGINVVMAYNDGGALGAAQAFKLAGKDPAKAYVASNEGTEASVQAVLKGDQYIKTINLLSIKKIADAIVDLPDRYFRTHRERDDIVGRLIIHSDEKAKLQHALTEY